MKAKFDPHRYLVLSQVIEYVVAQNDFQKEDELCDVMAVCIKILKEMGYDPVVSFNRRAQKKVKSQNDTKEEYNGHYTVIVDRMNQIMESLGWN